jgi:hypothetical protein
MTQEYRLMPNESIILKESGIAHDRAMATSSDELMLTNLNIIYTQKGMLGNTKNIIQYPLNQIKKFNGTPQVIMGKMSNGYLGLEIYFINGSVERFNFYSFDKKKINRWVDAIYTAMGCDIETRSDNSKSIIAEGSLAGTVKEVGGQFINAGSELLGAIGINLPEKKSTVNQNKESVTKKCVSCSAPLIGYKGQLVKCKYCDTKQTL